MIVVVALAAGIVAVAVGRPPAPFLLLVADIDGPTVDVGINGHVSGHLPGCGDDTTGDSPVFTPGPANELPWTVELRRSDGTSLGKWTETGTKGPRVLLMRGDQVADLAYPAPAGPMPSCGP